MRLPTTIALAACLAVTLPAQAPPQGGVLLVLSKSDLTLSTVDPATLKVLGRVPSGPDPHEVVASTDGRTAYISNYGGGSFNTITVIDLVAQKALPTIDLGALRGPHGLAFVAGKLWFTAEGAKVIGSYDPPTSQIDLVLGTGQNRTHMIFVTQDASRIITSNVSSATMTMIERTAGRGGGPGGAPPGGPARAGNPSPAAGAPPARGDAPPGGQPGRGPGGPGGPGGRGPGGPQSDWDETIVPVGRGAEGFDVSPDGATLWAANAQDGTISIVDVPGRKVTETLQAKVEGANRLKFTPDGKLVVVSTLRGPDVAIFDATTKREVKRVKVGTGAAGIQMQPDGSRVYVACTPDDYVTIIDLTTLGITGRIDAGRQPDGLAWATRR